MLSHQEYTAWISVGDQPLETYAVETSLATNEATGWIASEAGKARQFKLLAPPSLIFSVLRSSPCIVEIAPSLESILLACTSTLMDRTVVVSRYTAPIMPSPTREILVLSGRVTYMFPM